MTSRNATKQFIYGDTNSNELVRKLEETSRNQFMSKLNMTTFNNLIRQTQPATANVDFKTSSKYMRLSAAKHILEISPNTSIENVSKNQLQEKFNSMKNNDNNLKKMALYVLLKHKGQPNYTLLNNTVYSKFAFRNQNTTNGRNLEPTFLHKSDIKYIFGLPRNVALLSDLQKLLNITEKYKNTENALLQAAVYTIFLHLRNEKYKNNDYANKIQLYKTKLMKTNFKMFFSNSKH